MAKKVSDAEQVEAYMAALSHPMKAEIEQIRSIIKDSNSNIAERIKWNASSYYHIPTKEDIVTFGPPARSSDKILLVFHHPSIINIDSAILEGDYKDRRLIYFKNLEEIQSNQPEITRIMNEIIHKLVGC
jgi:hypothetical protein